MQKLCSSAGSVWYVGSFKLHVCCEILLLLNVADMAGGLQLYLYVSSVGMKYGSTDLIRSYCRFYKSLADFIIVLQILRRKILLQILQDSIADLTRFYYRSYKIALQILQDSTTDLTR